MKPPETLKMVAPGVWIDPVLLDAVRPVVAAPAGSDGMVLADDHVMWEHASGGNRNDGARQWTMNDLAEAAITLDAINGKKAGAFFDLLLDQPGRLFTSADLIAAAPDVFTSAYAIAGSLNGFRKHVDRADRVYPFHWWEGDADGTPTRYAVRPSVAAVFNAARKR